MTYAPQSPFGRDAAYSYRISPSDSMTDETQIEYFYAFKVVPVRLRCVQMRSQVKKVIASLRASGSLAGWVGIAVAVPA